MVAFNPANPGLPDVFPIAPLGTGADDWPRLFAALALNAGVQPVLMLPGLWQCKSLQQLPNNAHIIGGEGVRVQQSLAVGTGNALVAAFAIAQPPAVANSTIQANTTYGLNQLKCVSNGPFDAAAIVGAWLRVTQATNAFRVQLYQIVAASTVAGVTTLTTERPVRNRFAIGDVVEVVVPNRVVIEGRGMTIAGDGSRFVELFSCVAAVVTDLVLEAGTLSERLMSFDVGCVDCYGARIRANGNGVPLGLTFETGEQSTFEDCQVENAGVGYVFQDANVCGLVDCRAYDCSVGGVHFTSSGPTNEGANENTISGGDFSDNVGVGVAGIQLEHGSSFNNIVGARLVHNQLGIVFGAGGTQANNVINGCTITDHVQHGLEISASTVDTLLADSTLLRNTPGTTHLNISIIAGALRTRFAGVRTDGFFLQTAADTQVADVIGVQTTATGNTFIAVSGAAIVQIRGLDLTVPDSGVFGVDPMVNAIQAVGTSHVSVSDAHLTIGTNVAGFVTVAAGAVMSVSDSQVDKSGAGVQFGLFPFAGTIRIGLRVNVDNTSNPTFGAGHLSVGQLVSGGAGAGQAVAWPDIASTDRVTWTRVVNGGAPGVMPLTVVNPGVGFTATFAAGDTSTYEYHVN